MTKYERLMYEAECHGAKVIELILAQINLVENALII